ncbi:F-box domain-containing protein [Orpheovirus IHUMI-LCC2]|uniref:F-box domain-containing protein n=1 Tax=Orpheovirus IHUMI-LCC2 TaxID=2023057 RepID=A0A2I2L341_9VIRU|nr:F-box domain-containing protein [Orpheovirus IHUMI-LCC2]SNW61946.1 F-box domain-containing protein [Orpheovirus IHUMI-LCC2]
MELLPLELIYNTLQYLDNCDIISLSHTNILLSNYIISYTNNEQYKDLNVFLRCLVNDDTQEMKIAKIPKDWIYDNNLDVLLYFLDRKNSRNENFYMLLNRIVDLFNDNPSTYII